MAKSSMTKKALQPLRDQVASSLGVNLSDGANLTTAQVGHVGGQMVKKMIDSYTGTSSTSFRG
ncbi:MAG: alpha/beta-type small acid-soluble spore protein [Eubacteriaceae bacterium]